MMKISEDCSYYSDVAGLYSCISSLIWSVDTVCGRGLEEARPDPLRCLYSNPALYSSMVQLHQTKACSSSTLARLTEPFRDSDVALRYALLLDYCTSFKVIFDRVAVPRTSSQATIFSSG
jgi:hypothetical protein